MQLIRIVLIAVLGLLAFGLDAEALEVRSAKIRKAKIEVKGREAAPLAPITWEGTPVGESDARGKFKFQTTILPAPDAWDRGYNVDYYIPVEERSIGIQVKPITSGLAIGPYQSEEMHRGNHERFQKDH